MKMIIAIISSEDADDLVYELNQNSFFVTKLSTIGGFLKKKSTTLMLGVDVAVNLPAHAFDFLQLPQVDQCEAVDLLTGEKETLSLLPYKATDVKVGAWSGKILKITL